MVPAPTGKSKWLTGSRLISLIVVLVVVALISVVAGFGGFDQRADKRIDVEAGTVVDLNMVEVRVWEATAKEPAWEGGPWSVEVRAEVRNLSEVPLTSFSFRKAIGFAYTDGDGQPGYQDVNYTFIRLRSNPEKTSPRMVIPPGSDFMPVIFTFDPRDGIDLSKGVTVGLFPVVYAANTVLGLSDEKSWIDDLSATSFWAVKLPLQT